MSDLLHDLKYGPYPPSAVYKLLTYVEKSGIKYLLDELPEGETYKFYCEKLDIFMANYVKGLK